MILTEDDYLQHFGVKGMKWGVRRQRRLDRASRVASGKASKGEKFAFMMLDTSRASVSRNKGIQGAAASRVRELQSRKDRIQSGQAKVKDFIALNGGDRLWISGKK